MTNTWRTLVDEIHLGTNPYEGFPTSQWPSNWHGWESEHPWFTQAVSELRPTVVVEVGTFLGGSARYFAKCLRDLWLDSAVVCIDTWLAERVLWSSEAWRPTLLHRFGRPEFYNTFMANTIRAGLTDYIVPLPMSSTAAALFLEQLQVRAELVYIDGNHEEGDVCRDLDLYYDRVLKPGGRVLATYFLINDEALGFIKQGKSTQSFIDTGKGYWVIDEKIPEANTGYEEGAIRSMFAKYGLSIIEPIHWGLWCGRKDFLSYQDIIVASKT